MGALIVYVYILINYVNKLSTFYYVPKKHAYVTTLIFNS